MTLTMRERLERGLVMFYLGGTRFASDLLRRQTSAMSTNPAAINHLRAMADQARSLRGDIIADVDVIGSYLHEGWERKRTLSDGITNPLIDDAYARARAAGATGGKLLGAGSAGFLLVYAPGDARAAVVAALSEYRAYGVRFDMVGTSIIYSD